MRSRSCQGESKNSDLLFFIDYAKSLLIILSKKLTRFSAESSKLVKVTLVANAKESAAEVQQKKFRCLTF